MNSLDALAAAAKEGAGIGRVPSWQVEADLAADRLVRLLADDEPAPVPLHLMFQPSRLASPRIRTRGRLCVGRWRGIDRFSARPASTDKQNHYSALKPCQMPVVYQATDQSRFIAS